jgi:hypothetical protein
MDDGFLFGNLRHVKPMLDRHGSGSALLHLCAVVQGKYFGSIGFLPGSVVFQNLPMFYT